MAHLYGGDEVNAIVIDIGTNTLKAGYAGSIILRCNFSYKMDEVGLKRFVSQVTTCRRPCFRHMLVSSRQLGPMGWSPDLRWLRRREQMMLQRTFT
jgi:hypothetical protein